MQYATVEELQAEGEERVGSGREESSSHVWMGSFVIRNALLLLLLLLILPCATMGRRPSASRHSSHKSALQAGSRGWWGLSSAECNHIMWSQPGQSAPFSMS